MSACLATKSCLTLCDPMDCNSPGSSVHGILQVRILEWVVIPFSRGSSRPRDQTHVCLRLLHCRWLLYLLSSLGIPFIKHTPPYSSTLAWKIHGWRSLVGCSLWGCKESDTTEWLHFHLLLSCIGEGNGNPLQCSCLGNPRNGETWWAAVYGVTQSRTQLKQLSSSILCLHLQNHHHSQDKEYTH